jgi:hypothetical protein
LSDAQAKLLLEELKSQYPLVEATEPANPSW